MFTSIDAVSRQLRSEGLRITSIEYVDKGVMTDTYKVMSDSNTYCVRCYPAFRSWLVEAEYNYLEKLASHGVKVPVPVARSGTAGETHYIIYEWVEGLTLREIYDDLTEEEIRVITDEVIDNYSKISSIRTTGYGPETHNRIFEYESWKQFLKTEIQKSKEYFAKEDDVRHVDICDGLICYADTIEEPSPAFVWSDFSLDNIIISQDRHLSSFIDFEGILSGDILLGVSYLKSCEPYHSFTNSIISYFIGDNAQKQRLVDFYSVFRYVRLAPYSKMPTPNNSERIPLESFLSYVPSVEDQFRTKKLNMKQTIDVLKRNIEKSIVLIFTVLICVAALIGSACLYNPTLEESQITVSFVNDSDLLETQSYLPHWFCITDTTLGTYKIIDEEDKKILYKCVLPVDSSATGGLAYKRYLKAVDRLSYKSNTEFPNTSKMIWLTLCLVAMGCCARTLYNFIGRECYKEGQDMSKWWSWYVLRPIIGCPIAAFILFAFRTSMFESLFTSKDLNTYLVVAFLAGFATMEFLAMLRRASKALFGE